MLFIFSKFYFFPLFSDVFKRFSANFLYEFKLNQSGVETVRKINQTFGNDGVNENTVRRWFAKIPSRVLAPKMNPEMVDLQ